MGQGEWRKSIVVLILLFYVTETQTASIYHLCGIQLVDTLLMVCEGKGLYYRTIKSRLHTDSHFADRNKKKIGIVEKCCHHTCTYYDLQSYCKS